VYIYIRNHPQQGNEQEQRLLRPVTRYRQYCVLCSTNFTTNNETAARGRSRPSKMESEKFFRAKSRESSRRRRKRERRVSLDVDKTIRACRRDAASGRSEGIRPRISGQRYFDKAIGWNWFGMEPIKNWFRRFRPVGIRASRGSIPSSAESWFVYSERATITGRRSLASLRATNAGLYRIRVLRSSTEGPLRPHRAKEKYFPARTP